MPPHDLLVAAALVYAEPPAPPTPTWRETVRDVLILAAIVTTIVLAMQRASQLLGLTGA